MTGGSSSRLPALLAALRLHVPGLPWAATHCLAALHLSARQLATAAGAAAAQEAAGSSAPEAAAKPPARRRRQAATPAPSKPLAPRTIARLERDAMVATFAVKLGLKPTDGSTEALEQQGPSQATAASAAAAAEHPPPPVEAWAAGELGGAGPPAATRAAAEQLQEKREERRKRQPPTYPSYEVFDTWLAEHDQQLLPLRRYLGQELGMPHPERTIAMLFRKGPRARDLMLPEPQPLVIPLEAAEPQEGEKKGKKKRKSKKDAAAEAEAEAAAAGGGEAAAAAAAADPAEGKAKKKRGRKKAGEEEISTEQLGAAGAAELPLGEDAALAAEQLQQQQQQQEGSPQALPRLASVAAEWQALLQEAGLLPAGGLKELAVRHPSLLVLPPPGGREATLARLAEIRGLLGWEQAHMAEIIQRAPELLFATTAAILRRLEFLRLHAHVVGAQGDATLRLLPALLWARESQLTETVRVLVQYSRSMASYTSLVRWHPQLLLSATSRRAAALEDALRALLPPKFDPALVIKSWPLLLLPRPRLLRRRWEELREMCAKVPAWQDELDQLLAVPSTAQPGQQQREEGHAAAGDEQAAAAQAKGSKRRRKVPTGPTRQQYHSLARLLELRPDQQARLEFLLEMHPEAAAEGDEPLVGLVTMRPRAFERKFPGLAEWLQQRREQLHAEQEQAQAELEWQQAEQQQQQQQALDGAGDAWSGIQAPVPAEQSLLETPRQRGRPKAGSMPAAAAAGTESSSAAASSGGGDDGNASSGSDSDSDSSTDGASSSSGSSSDSDSGGEEGGPPVRAAPQKRARRSRRAAAAAVPEQEAEQAAEQAAEVGGTAAAEAEAGSRAAGRGSVKGSGRRGRKKKTEEQLEDEEMAWWDEASGPDKAQQ